MHKNGVYRTKTPKICEIGLSNFGMATIKLTMDSRRETADGKYPVRLSIAKNHKTAYIGTEINLTKEQWNRRKCLCVSHPNKILINRKLKLMKLEAERIDLCLQMKDSYRFMSALDLKSTILKNTSGDHDERGEFEEYFLKIADTKSKSTKGVYMQTYSRLKKHCGDKLHSLGFSDITPSWLRDFETFLAKTAPSANSRGIHLRNIRAIFNSAITDELTKQYPFRRFKIKAEKTRHRALCADRLRTLFDYPCEDYQRRHIDMFKLSFLLIGINMADMARLKSVDDGRIHYVRCKTHTPYSIKVEPEALALIETYKGKNWLLDILDRYSDHNDYTKRCNRSLQKVGHLKRSGLGGKKDIKSEFPGLTLYWARHSWASIASFLGIPQDVIGEALGHADKSVTKIYIDFDRSKIDRANRLVIDYVLYGKKRKWVSC